LPNRLLLLALFPQSPFSPDYSPFLVFDPEKRGGRLFWFVLFAYLLRSIRMITKPTAMIAMIMPIVAGMKYVSAIDGSGGGAVGVA